MKTVDKYQFNQEQGKNIGGIQFFVAYHTILKKNFTLKRLNISSETDPNYQLLMKQITILKKFNHESIYKCHKMLKTKNNIYFIYDNLDIPTLYQSIQNGISFDTRISILKQLSSALLDCHKNHISNLSINSKNIILLQHNKIKIIDFSLAQQIPQNLNFIKLAQELKFVMNQYSPPQLIDRRAFMNSDCFSFGILIKQLFAEQFSLRGKNQTNSNIKMIQNLHNLANKLVTKVPEIRPNIKQIVSTLNKQEIEEDNFSLNRSTKTFKSQKESKDQKGKNQNIYINNYSYNQENLPKLKGIEHFSSLNQQSQKNIGSIKRLNIELDDKIEQLTKKIYKKRKFAIALLFMASSCSINKQSKPFFIMRLSYLLVKKATIIISQLAKLMRTGKGFDILISEKIKEGFTKSNQFSKLNPIINKEMYLTQQKFQSIVQDLKTVPQLQKDRLLKEELSSQKINNQYLKKCVSQFLHELHLSYNPQYLNQYDKDHLLGIYMISLLSSYQTYEHAFEDLFSESTASFSNELIIKEVLKFSKETIIQFIELAIHDYDKTESKIQLNLSKSHKSIL